MASQVELLNEYNLLLGKSDIAILWPCDRPPPRADAPFPSASQVELLNEYNLLTGKPGVYLVNMSEKDFLRCVSPEPRNSHSPNSILNSEMATPKTPSVAFPPRSVV